MKVATLTMLSLVAGVVLTGACGAPPSEQQAAPPTVSIPPPSGPPVSINAEMVTLVDHAAHALWDVEREGKAPKTDAEWANVEEHATQMAAVGHLISVPGTGANDLSWTQMPDWQKFSRATSDAGLAALEAAKARNMEALVAANGQLVEVCESCHKAFKPALPSEGISHQHTH